MAQEVALGAKLDSQMMTLARTAAFLLPIDALETAVRHPGVQILGWLFKDRGLVSIEIVDVKQS
jgi:hypothetical protein